MAMYRKDLSDKINLFFDTVLFQTKDYNSFLGTLVNDDDWSFVIKTTAFFEAIITQLLVKFVGNDKLSVLFDKMPLNRKIHYLHEFNLCSKQEMNFLNYYSSLRNKLAHNITDINFSFKELIDNFSDSEKRDFINKIKIEDEEQTEDQKKLLLSNPKIALWVILSSLGLMLFSVGELEVIKRDLIELDAKTSNDLLRNIFPEILSINADEFNR